MAVSAPSNAVFLDRFPEFAKAPAALVTTWVAAAARRTSSNIYTADQEVDAVCLKAAVLLTKSPQARALKLVGDEQGFVWAQELYELQRSATMGIRVF
jgi:hypothetical protein